MPRTYVKRRLLTSLYKDLCTATKEHPVAPTDRGLGKREVTRGDFKRQLCFFPSDSYVGQSNEFVLFEMPVGTEHEGWRLAVPRNRVQRMRKGPVRKLRDGYVVRYPASHYAYPIVRGDESSVIETDDIQSELLFGLYHELLPSDSVAHWVRVGKNHMIRVKLHGMNSRDKRTTICGRVVMRDYWNDQYFNSVEGRGKMFLSDVHATTVCRMTAIMDSGIRDFATDGSRKAKSRAVNLGDEWYECKCGYYGPAEPDCRFHTTEGHRHPTFTVRCPECGRDCTPTWFREMNQSIFDYAKSHDGYEPFSEKTPTYTILRTKGAETL